ncbi:MAG: FISUMP domain-containing protein [Lentimicrobium sp.]
MKAKISFLFVALALMLSAYGQKPALELTFTAVDNASFVKLDSIKVMNRNLPGRDTVLYYPDTVLVLDYLVGITEISQNKTGLQVFQNYPNPVEDQTTITLYIPEKDNVDLTITDILGRQFIHARRVLDKGYHSFRFTPGIGNLFFLTAIWKGNSSSIKVLHSASDSHMPSSLEYIGTDNSSPQLKSTEAVQYFCFAPGDRLLYIGYSDTLHSGILNSPATSETFIFQFATNIPCPGTPTVTYEGQVYNTIQIFSQCWFKENLNVGTMIPGTQEMSNNGVIEKYCFNDNTSLCNQYGGLYQWYEMMQYTSQQGTQGICPPGWHLPTDEEWKVLEGAVDSQYGIGDNTWDNEDYRGYDAGTNLKTTGGWNWNGNGTDLFGFSGLPGGYRDRDGNFPLPGYYGNWWTSTKYQFQLHHWVEYRSLLYYSPEVYRDNEWPANTPGFSARCLRDN